MAKRKMGGGDPHNIALPPQSTSVYPKPSGSEQRRRRRTTQLTAAGPSSGVLSLLATISAASYPVNGSPLPTPPPFLCPSIVREGSARGCDPIAQRYIRDNLDLIGDAGASTSTLAPTTTAAPSPSSSIKSPPPPTLADRFEKGADGQWRRVDKYTIYGSTVCRSCTTDAVTGLVAEASSSASSTTATATTKDRYDVATPDGWSTPVTIDTHRLKLILTVSLVLSFFICGIMIAVSLWRRRRNKRRKAEKDKEGYDEEFRLTKRRWRGRDGEQGEGGREALLLQEQQARVKQKFWALSTARWKASIRVSMIRRRNGRRLAAQSQFATSQSNSSAASTLQQPASVSETTATGVTASRPASPPPSMAEASPRASLALDRTHGSASPPRSPSPPAYIRPRAAMPLLEKVSPVPALASSCAPPNLAPSIDDNTNDETDSHNHNHHDPDYTASIPNGEGPISYSDSEINSFSLPNSHPPYPMTYSDSSPAAHVATDDKALLARMADLASAPPPLDGHGDHHARTDDLEVSAPAWQDEDMDMAMDTEASQHASTSAINAHFPLPPPPAAHASTSGFYEYPTAFASEEPAADLPSAPATEDEEANTAHAPSAPPLELESSDHATAPVASAPGEWDWLEREDGQGDDRHRHRSSSASTLEFLPLPVYRA